MLSILAGLWLAVKAEARRARRDDAAVPGAARMGPRRCRHGAPRAEVVHRGGWPGVWRDQLRRPRRRTADLAAPVDLSHVSTVLCHTGNISYRTGAPAAWADVAGAVEGFVEAPALAADLKRHVETHGIDPEKQRFMLGEWLTLDGDAIASVASGNPASFEQARSLETETQRPPYRIPEAV